MKGRMRVLLIGLMLCHPFFSYGQERDQNDLNQLVPLSDRAYRSGDYNEFHRLMTQIMEQDSGNFRCRYNMACVCALTGDVQRAAAHLNFLLDEDDDLVLFLENDADFNDIRNTVVFKRITDRIKEKTQPVNRSRIALIIQEKDLVP